MAAPQEETTQVRRALVVVPSVFGATPDLLEQLAGFDAPVDRFMVDPFEPHAPGPLPYDEVAAALSRARSIDRDEVARKLCAAVAEARAQVGPEGWVVALGICFGGRFVFEAAADGLVDAAVIWHGGGLGACLHRANEVRVPLSMHFGADDAIIPLEDVIDVRMAFAGRGNVEVALYPGAAHGFTHPDGPAFKASAADGAMASLRYLLEDEEELVGGAA